jgi:hypothetical protein
MRIKYFYLKSLEFLLIFSLCYGYKPVVLFHGILSDAGRMLIVAERIKLVSSKVSGIFLLFFFDDLEKKRFEKDLKLRKNSEKKI